MKELKPFMIGVCLVASLGIAGCADQNSGGAPQPAATDSTGNPSREPEPPGDGGHTASFSEPGQPSTDDQGDSTSYVSTDFSPPSIGGESALSIGRDYRLQLLLDGRWTEFRQALPTGDLTGQERDLRSYSDVSAKLTCGDANCSESEVVLSYGEKTAHLHFRHLKMQALRGELQQDCTVPLFFDYEIDDLIGASSVLKSGIQQYQKISSVEATLSRTETWDREEFESINVDLFADSNEVMSLNDPKRTSGQKMNLRKSRIPPAKNFSYGLIGEGPNLTLDFIKFHFPTNNGSSGEVCYHLPLIPQVLER